MKFCFFFPVSFCFTCLGLSSLVMFHVCNLYARWILYSEWVLIYVCFMHCILLAFVSTFSHPMQAFIALLTTQSKSISIAWYIQPITWCKFFPLLLISHLASVSHSVKATFHWCPQDCLFHNDKLTSSNSKLLRRIQKLQREQSWGWQTNY